MQKKSKESEEIITMIIDNVKVYSTQLTASQVQDSYNQMLVENAVTDFTLNETEQLKRDIRKKKLH